MFVEIQLFRNSIKIREFHDCPVSEKLFPFLARIPPVIRKTRSEIIMRYAKRLNQKLMCPMHIILPENLWLKWQLRR